MKLTKKKAREVLAHALESAYWSISKNPSVSKDTWDDLEVDLHAATVALEFLRPKEE